MNKANKLKEYIPTLHDGQYCFNCLVAADYIYATKDKCICSCHKKNVKNN